MYVCVCVLTARAMSVNVSVTAVQLIYRPIGIPTVHGPHSQQMFVFVLDAVVVCCCCCSLKR